MGQLLPFSLAVLSGLLAGFNVRAVVLMLRVAWELAVAAVRRILSRETGKSLHDSAACSFRSQPRAEQRSLLSRCSEKWAMKF